MKNNFKKVFALMLAGLLSASLLVGCGGSEGDDNVITILVAENEARSGKSQDTPVSLALEEKFGVKFEYMTQATNDAIAALLPNLAGSNLLPDMIMTQTIELNKFGKFFVNYNDYRTQMPNMVKYIDEETVSNQLVQEDGSFTIAPVIYDIHTWVAYMIRVDWLENLGYEEGWVPDTLSEFEEVMIEFANDDPNGDGLKTEVGFYPMAPAEWLRDHAMNYGISPENYIKNGEVVYGPLQPEYRGVVMRLNELYNEGVFVEGFTTHTMTEYQQYISSGRVGFTRAYFNRIEDVLEWSSIGDSNAEWKIILPPKNDKTATENGVEDGGTGLRYEQRYMDRVGNFGLALNKRCSSAKIKKMVEIIDYLYSEEGRRLTSYGVEGETYDMVNGVPTFKDFMFDPNERPFPDSRLTKMYYGIEPASGGFSLVQDRNSFIFTKPAMDGVALYEENADMFNNLKLAPPVTLILNYQSDAERNAATRDWYTVNAKEMSATYEFISGVKSAASDSHWNNFLKTLNDYNINDIMQVINSAYDRIVD